MACHLYLGGHPLEFAVWVDKYLLEYTPLSGETLRLIANSGTPRFRAGDMAEIKVHLKAELMRVLELRQTGFTGRCEFTSPPPVSEFVRAK